MIFRQAVLAAGALLAGSIIASSCSRDSPGSRTVAGRDSAQYSIRAYVQGQVGLLQDQPLALCRIYRDEKRFDSAYAPITELDWGAVIPVFLKTDISAPEFTGKYRFSIADDNLTATRTLVYDALRPDLFTRLFQINTDMSDHMIKSIYIETHKSGFWRSTTQKLLYVPNRIVQIQETENPLIGATSHRRLEYRFPPSSDRETTIEE